MPVQLAYKGWSESKTQNYDKPTLCYLYGNFTKGSGHSLISVFQTY